MTKPVRQAISFVLRRAGSSDEVLLVLRPPDDLDLPNVWGLPAGSVRAGETPQDAVRRAGREKLGVELEVGRELRRGRTERAAYMLEMALYDARIRAGEPRVPQLAPGVTQYVDWRWGRAEELRPAAAQGSLCCRLYLEAEAGADR